MAVFEDDYRLNNIFRRIVSSKTFCDKYDLVPGQFQNIAQGKKSTNVIIKALATSIQDIENALKEKELKIGYSKNDSSKYLDEAEMKTIYRKLLAMVTE